MLYFFTYKWETWTFTALKDTSIELRKKTNYLGLAGANGLYPYHYFIIMELRACILHCGLINIMMEDWNTHVLCIKILYKIAFGGRIYLINSVSPLLLEKRRYRYFNVWIFISQLYLLKLPSLLLHFCSFPLMEKKSFLPLFAHFCCMFVHTDMEITHLDLHSKETYLTMHCKDDIQFYLTCQKWTVPWTWNMIVGCPYKVLTIQGTSFVHRKTICLLPKRLLNGCLFAREQQRQKNISKFYYTILKKSQRYRIIPFWSVNLPTDPNTTLCLFISLFS